MLAQTMAVGRGRQLALCSMQLKTSGHFQAMTAPRSNGLMYIPLPPVLFPRLLCQFCFCSYFECIGLWQSMCRGAGGGGCAEGEWEAGPWRAHS